jgi:hypothetical protein
MYITTDIKNAMYKDRQLSERPWIGLPGFKFGSLEGNIKLLQGSLMLGLVVYVAERNVNICHCATIHFLQLY